MIQTYFVYQDSDSVNRQSDGVELCIVEGFYDGKIYFYCSEYMVLWSRIEDVGNFNKEVKINQDTKIRPASLLEICEHNLCGYITTIKQYTIDNNRMSEIKYIHLK